MSAGVYFLPVDVVCWQFGESKGVKEGSILCCFLCDPVGDVSAVGVFKNTAELV